MSPVEPFRGVRSAEHPLMAGLARIPTPGRRRAAVAELLRRAAACPDTTHDTGESARDA